MSQGKKLRFEDGLEQLEALIASMESGELSLEDTLKAYESGLKLQKQLSDMLTAGERRLERAIEASDGTTVVIKGETE